MLICHALFPFHSGDYVILATTLCHPAQPVLPGQHFRVSTSGSVSTLCMVLAQSDTEERKRMEGERKRVTEGESDEEKMTEGERD